jgi:hypothetical protein
MFLQNMVAAVAATTGAVFKRVADISDRSCSAPTRLAAGPAPATAPSDSKKKVKTTLTNGFK